MRRGMAVLLACVVPMWLTVVVVRGWISWVEPGAVASSVANTVILVVWVLLVVELARSRTHDAFGSVSRWRRPFLWLTAATVVSPAVAQPARTVVPVVAVDSTVAASPAVAAWALAQIVDRRRATVMSLSRPRRLSDDELHVLAMLRRQAREMRGGAGLVDVAIEVAPVVSPTISGLVASTESICDAVDPIDPDWLFLARVMGHPEVITRDGRKVNFRKGRSLELTVWLALNRDRMSRSLARTAIWDVDVSDATFATVVSEMRRALRDAEPSLPRDEISQATFSDEMHLHAGVVTDVDLLAHSADAFAGDAASAESLAETLSLVRALPFAGASYEWADLDGTTTRIVICVVDAAVRLGEWAIVNARPDLASVALTAGMRVMSGHPDLVRLEREILASVRG